MLFKAARVDSALSPAYILRIRPYIKDNVDKKMGYFKR